MKSVISFIIFLFCCFEKIKKEKEERDAKIKKEEQNHK